MTIFFVVLIGVVLFVIAAVAIGRETNRLEQLAPKPNFETDTAAIWIGDRLASEHTSQLSYDDVHRIVIWSTEFFGQIGLRTDAAGSPARTEAAQSTVVDLSGMAAHVAARAVMDLPDRALTTEQINAVLALVLAYMDEIGAVGVPAQQPTDGSEQDA
jgi:hypothetical protein